MRRVPSLFAVLLVASSATAEPRVDRHGDPLPKDALLRIGTVRLRHAASLMSVVFTPDGKTIISASVHDSVRLWDAATGAPKGVLPQLMNGGVIALAVSPDGKTLAASNPDSTVRFWDIATLKPLAACRGHTGPVRALFFTPDGKTLITAGGDGGAPGDGTLRFWDAVTGGEQHQIKADSDWIFSARPFPRRQAPGQYRRGAYDPPLERRHARGSAFDEVRKQAAESSPFLRTAKRSPRRKDRT